MNEQQKTPSGDGTGSELRVLIPVAFGSQGENGVRYVLAQSASGRRVSAVLACIGDEHFRPEVLRLRTQEEVLDFQKSGATAAMEEVAAPLHAAGIPVQAVFGIGSVARQLTRIAEETGCHEIAVPAREGKLLPLTGPLAALARSHGSGNVRLRVVDGDGQLRQTAAAA